MGASLSSPVEYAHVVANSSTADHGAIRRNIASPDRLISHLNPQVESLYDNFKHGVNLEPQHPCLGTRSMVNNSAGAYEWISYGEVENRMINFGSGLLHLHLAESQQQPFSKSTLSISGNSLVALFSTNCAEWVIAEQACNAYSLATVPLYDTLGFSAVQYILNQTELLTCVVSENQFQELLKTESSTLKYIILMSEVTDAHKALVSTTSYKLYSMKEIESIGSANQCPIVRPLKQMLATVCYTSGTTGQPKGACLTHENIIACSVGGYMQGVEVSRDDVHISYLPLAHMFERIIQVSLLYHGSSIGFFRGDVKCLMDDIQELKPTLFPSVPRLFNRIFDKILSTVASSGKVKNYLFQCGLESKKYNLQNRGWCSHPLYDQLIFNKIRDRLGGRVRLMVTGSAPISADVLDFLRVCFSCPVLEGYGQTETGAAATITFPHDTTSGHVGGPLSCNEICLFDVPDMNYSTKNAKMESGEICFRGPNIFQGYYKDLERTSEAIDSDEWLHSGDIGCWLPNNSLKIIDRKKNIFKLSQGEYVAAEKIENVYMKSSYIAQCFVYGDSLESSLVGIVVPDEEVVAKWVKQNNIPGSNFSDWCQSEQLKSVIWTDMSKMATEARLKGFEVVRDIYIDSDLFSTENDLLTPTFKLKRSQAKQKYQNQINSMYIKVRRG